MENEIEKLKKINEDKSEVVSTTAHQIRTSLSALKWILKMFIDGDVGKLTPEQNDLIKKADEVNKQSLAMINDLLVLNHTEEVSTSYNFQKINIVDIINEILNDFSGETTKNNIKVNLTVPEGQPLFVSCDPKMIHIVFQNLIENSIKYSKSGNIVSISLEEKNGEMLISFYDKGIGIKGNDKDNIFKKFFRAQNAEEKDKVGSGLGLYITKKIVERHQGKIWFENNKDGGTTFFVVLPIN